MRIYFDRNIYNMARDQGCVGILAQFLQSKSLLLPFSGQIMQEIDGISDYQLRKAAYKDVGILTNNFISDPSLMICQEFLVELRRLRPDWLSPYITVNLTDRVQENRKQLWLDLKNGGTDHADLRREGDPFRAESKKSANKAQRHFRDRLRGQPFVIYNKGSGEITSQYEMDTRDNQWREDCVVFWHEALIGRNPAYRDAIGFTSPLVNSEALKDVDSLAKFWFKEVNCDNVRLNKIRGLVWHIQRDMKLESGNPGDIGHASYMNLVDVFITADARFSMALTELKSLMSLPANVLLLEREGDLMNQLKAAFP